MSLKNNIIANVCGQIWSAIMKLAFVPIYIKLLGIESYGLIGMFALLQAWFVVLDLGLSPTINREMARFNSGGQSANAIRNILHSIECIAFIVATLIALGVSLGSDWLGNELVKTTKLSQSEVVNAFTIMGVVAALRFFEGIYHYAMIGLERQVLFNLINALMHTIRSVGAVAVLIWWKPTIQSFFIWQGISSIAQTTFLAIVIYNILPNGDKTNKFSFNSLVSIRKFAGGMFLMTILSLGVTQIDKLILSGLLDLEQFGYYTLATTVASTLYMIAAPIIQAAYPRMIGLATIGNKERLASLYHESAQLIAIATAAITMLISFFSENVIYLWTHDLILTKNTAPILSIMVIGSFFGVLNQIPQSCQLAHNLVVLPLINNSIALVLLTLLIYLVMPLFGMIGVVWAVAITMLIFSIISTQIMHSKILRLEKKEFYIKDTLLPFIGAFLPTYFASRFHPKDYNNFIAWLIFLITVLMVSVIFSITLSQRIKCKLQLYCKKYLTFLKQYAN